MQGPLQSFHLTRWQMQTAKGKGVSLYTVFQGLHTKDYVAAGALCKAEKRKGTHAECAMKSEWPIYVALNELDV